MTTTTMSCPQPSLEPDRPILLRPGSSHPHPPLTPSALAGWLGVSRRQVAVWGEAGLPIQDDGRHDPFAACNWVVWHRLAEAPALARRWRTYLNHFRRSWKLRRLVWNRTHHLYLPPGPVRDLCWCLPGPIDHPGIQQILAPGTLEGPAGPACQTAGGWRLDLPHADGPQVCRGRATVICRPVTAVDPAVGAHLARLVAPLVDGFSYGYRHREPVCDGPPDQGDCLDCALALGRLLTADGWTWRLVGGLVAHPVVANPHFWLEVAAGSAGWIPVDASLPAIARMLGEDPRPWIHRLSGTCDAGRIILSVDPAPESDGFPSATPGQARAILPDGTPVEAWPCLDWVGGDCTAEFTLEVTEDH